VRLTYKRLRETRYTIMW